MTEIEKLAERVEAATGPDRELDFLIAEATSTTPGHWQGCRCRQDRPYDYSKGADPWPIRWEWGQPAYTASLDAAMTLVPEDAFWRVGHDGEGPDPGLFRADVLQTPGAGHHIARALTPALALCAAALRTQKDRP